MPDERFPTGSKHGVPNFRRFRCASRKTAAARVAPPPGSFRSEGVSSRQGNRGRRLSPKQQGIQPPPFSLSPKSNAGSNGLLNPLFPSPPSSFPRKFLLLDSCPSPPYLWTSSWNLPGRRRSSRAGGIEWSRNLKNTTNKNRRNSDSRSKESTCNESQR